jgi:hypothetical protein
MRGWGRRCGAGALVLAFVPSLLPGCANKYNTYQNPDDACYAARQPLIAMGTDFQQTVLGATAVGAVTGAAIGGLARGDWQSAVIGAAAGAFAGSLVGYLDAKQRSAQSQAQVLALIDQDASHDKVLMTNSSNAISNLIACRDAEIRTIEASYQAHTMTPQQALAAYRNLQTQMQEDDKLISDLLGAADEREAKYVSARADTLSLRDPVQAASPATEQLATVRQQARQKQVAYKDSLAVINRQISDLERAVG